MQLLRGRWCEQRLLRPALWISALAAVALPLLHVGLVTLKWHIDRYYDAFIWLERSLMVCLTCVVCLLLLKLRNSPVFRSFQCVGQTTLTNYLVRLCMS